MEDIAGKIYACMPVVALVQTSHYKVLALHGGPTQDLTSQKAAQLSMQPTPTDEVLVDILWSDIREGVEEPLPSYRRAGKIYGQKGRKSPQKLRRRHSKSPRKCRGSSRNVPMQAIHDILLKTL